MNGFNRASFTFANLLARLDQGIEYALENDEIIDEINRR
jgi:hypothetical protein